MEIYDTVKVETIVSVVLPYASKVSTGTFYQQFLVLEHATRRKGYGV